MAIALVAVVLPVWQKREYAIALNGLAAQSMQQAAVSESLRAQLERQVGDYNFALERKYAYPGAVRVLEDVTRILPDDTWLTQLEIKTSARGKDAQRDVALRGESANAGRLVTLLEDSKLFTQAAPRSPTTKIQPGPGEIFDVGAQLKPLPPPPPIALVAADTAAKATPPNGAAPGSASPPVATLRRRYAPRRYAPPPRRRPPRRRPPRRRPPRRRPPRRRPPRRRPPRRRPPPRRPRDPLARRRRHRHPPHRRRRTRRRPMQPADQPAAGPGCAHESGRTRIPERG